MVHWAGVGFTHWRWRVLDTRCVGHLGGVIPVHASVEWNLPDAVASRSAVVVNFFLLFSLLMTDTLSWWWRLSTLFSTVPLRRVLKRGSEVRPFGFGMCPSSNPKKISIMGTKFHWAFAQWNFTKAAQIQNIYDLNLWTIIWFSFASAQNLRVLKTPWFGICGDTVIWVRAPYLLQRFVINIWWCVCRFEDAQAHISPICNSFGMLLSDFSGVYASSVLEATPLEWPQTVTALLMRDPDVAGKFWW